MRIAFTIYELYFVKIPHELHASHITCSSRDLRADLSPTLQTRMMYENMKEKKVRKASKNREIQHIGSSLDPEVQIT